MSAETLRRAAALMRERAGLAMPGPWVAFWPGDGTTRVVEQVSGERDEVAACGSIAESDHIASWHPAVALAVADWLDAEAWLLDSLEPFVSMFDAALNQVSGGTARLSLGRTEDGQPDLRADSSEQALAVARAYLGEQP